MGTIRRNDSDFNSANPGVRVLLAEDSATIRRYLADLINETPGMAVVGEARDGQEALELVAELRPDVVSMDIRMPRMDGLEATRRIMAECPTPVVVVSGLVESDVELSFEAIEAGALAVVGKPPARTSPEFPEKHRQLVKTLVAMSGVSVVRRPTDRLRMAQPQGEHPVAVAVRTPEIIAVGASAGGPRALGVVLGGFPAKLPVPIVISQHIPHEFIVGLARWLEKHTALPVKVAVDSMILEPGVVNLSPGTAHLTVVRQRSQLVARLIEEQGHHRYQPSVNALFESVATACGEAAVGLVLTGMGDDGAAGLTAMRRAGARTFAQDKRTATVFGMPGAAIERGAVERVLPLEKLSSAVMSVF